MTNRPSPQQGATLDAESPPTDTINILIVDDEPKNLLVLETLLSGPGRVLVRAESGREALRCVLDSDFAAILLDVQMDGLDGFETAALIRQRERSSTTPIIFLTAADGGSTFVTRGYAAGAVDYLHKPYDPHVLQSKLAVFVDLFRMSERVKQQAAQLASRAHMDGILLAARTFEHELNTKLSSTVGYCQLLLRDPTLPDHLRERAERALIGAQEASDIIRRIIELTDAKVIDWGETGNTTIDVRPAQA